MIVKSFRWSVSDRERETWLPRATPIARGKAQQRGCIVILSYLYGDVKVRERVKYQPQPSEASTKASTHSLIANA